MNPRKNPISFNCIFCGTENAWKKSCVNKYCNNKCQRDHQFIVETAPRVERGEAKGPALKNYLRRTTGDLCSICGCGSEWQGKPLTLQLDHVDGNSDNNALENVRLLCPNCHSQTDTYGARGAGNRYRKTAARNVALRKWKGYEEDKLE